MLRTWKILNRHRQWSKQIKNETIFILKRQTEAKVNLVETVFNALKLNKELEKEQKVHTRLHDEENERINQANKKIKSVQARTAHKSTKRAVQTGVLHPFSLVLKSYFDHWNKMNKEYKITLNAKIKTQIIKVYK